MGPEENDCIDVDQQQFTGLDCHIPEGDNLKNKHYSLFDSELFT
jgi:hypothetical protein